MDFVRTYQSPQLRDPVMIAAFAGWNDASEAATFAGRYLVEEWGARKMAEIDPEEFYVFTETRPQIRVPGRFQRHVEWPANEFYFYANREGDRDAIVLLGVEPQLRWRTFTDAVLGFARQRGVSTIVTLGALVADVPHTLPVPLSGTASPSWLARRLRRLGVEPTRYSGPTGILGVLSSAAARRRVSTASLWGSAPEYLSASPNPKVALALLERAVALLELDVDLGEMGSLERQFDRQVAEIVAEDPELQAYVRELEERSERAAPEQPPRALHEPLPSGEDLIRELEEYLRRRRGENRS